MYSRCIVCRSFLGRNEVLEVFPVGRRLAYDPRNGRLWVLCGSCRRWNLTPLEERWEAVEAMERLFEDATVGASTENVALGRLADATELVRVGAVRRPELAAWRYGERLLGRWRRHRRLSWLGAGLGLATGSVLVGGAGYAAMIGWVGLYQLREQHPVLRTREGHDIRRGDADRARLEPAPGAPGWQLSVPRLRGSITLQGDEAMLALRRLLPRANQRGGSPEEVRNATVEVETLGSAATVIREAADELGHAGGMDPRQSRWRRQPHRLAAGHPVLRLALEMAVNEETERRALEGELGLLEREWREAEELAAIADDLLVPAALRDRLLRLKGGSGS